MGSVAVIPMRLKVHRHSRINADAPGTHWRGDVEVVFGAPMRSAIDADPNQATAEIQEAVAAL